MERNRSRCSQKIASVGFLICAILFLAQNSLAEFKPTYTTDWVWYHVKKWNKILAEYKGKPNIRYLEVGTYEGRSAFWMMDNILTDPTAEATLVDVFAGPYEQVFLANLNSYPRKNQIKVVKGLSQVELRKLPLESFDLIYVDGDHTAKAVLLDAAAAWGLLKENGILLFDDYIWKEKEWPVDMTPRMPLQIFLTAFGEDIEVLDDHWQVVVRKRSSPVPGSIKVGKYFFNLWQMRLTNPLDSKDALTLNKKEEQVLLKYLQTRKMGKASLSIPKSLRSNLTFQQLAKKLDIKL